MIPLADAIVEWDLLLQVVYSALAVGLGVALAFSLAVAGATRFADERRNGANVRATLWAVLAAMGLAICAASIVLGLIVMTTKD